MVYGRQSATTMTEDSAPLDLVDEIIKNYLEHRDDPPPPIGSLERIQRFIVDG